MKLQKLLKSAFSTSQRFRMRNLPRYDNIYDMSSQNVCMYVTCFPFWILFVSGNLHFYLWDVQSIYKIQILYLVVFRYVLTFIISLDLSVLLQYYNMFGFGFGFGMQRRDYGAWEQYLGLEHSDTTPKRSFTANQVLISSLLNFIPLYVSCY